MKIQHKFSKENHFPLYGCLVSSESPGLWLDAIDALGLQLHEVKLYPLAGKEANTVWGCFLAFDKERDMHLLPQYQACQKVHDKLYIAAHTMVQPIPSEIWMAQRIGDFPILFHPELSWLLLEKAVDPMDLLDAPQLSTVSLTKPDGGIVIPKMIRLYRKEAQPIEETLSEVIKEHKPKKLADEPLTRTEKSRLKLYREVFGEPGSENGGSPFLANILLAVMKWFSGGAIVTKESMKEDHQELEDRSKDELQRFFDLLKKNPEEGLKYAIPLDEKGVTRGKMLDSSAYRMQQMRNDLSLGQRGGTGGGSINMGDHFHKMRQEYLRTARKFIEAGAIDKAVFVYVKLLNEPNNAIKLLEDEKRYQEAAAMCLKYLKNKRRAMELYAKGAYYQEAIELGIALEDYKAVGAFYGRMNQRQLSHKYYSMHADLLYEDGDYLGAAKVYIDHVDAKEKALQILDEGASYHDFEKHIAQYLDYLDTEEERFLKLQSLHQTDLNSDEQKDMITLFQKEYAKQNAHAPDIMEMSYECLSELIEVIPNLAIELQPFQKHDHRLAYDIMRFRKSI